MLAGMPTDRPRPYRPTRLEELEARSRELESIPELELTTDAVTAMNQKTIDDIDRWLRSQNSTTEFGRLTEDDVRKLKIEFLKDTFSNRRPDPDNLEYRK